MSLARIAAAITAALCLAAPAARAAPLFDPWINGVSASEPQMQVQRYDDDTYVVRQSIRTNFEGPFLYLLFGKDHVLLLDTGAGGLEVRPTIDRLIEDWRVVHGLHAAPPLIVAHSHGHGDHHQGDAEFADRKDTTVVGLKAEEVASFFGVKAWPTDVARYDLGGRVIDIIPTPGHQPAHIMVFDENTRLLLSGDALYPGRLYFPFDQLAAYRDSIDRVVAFTKDRKVSHILGAHIEMTTTPGKDFAMEAPTHPNERALELPYSDLLALQAAVHAMGDKARVEKHDDFIVYPIPPKP
ncbi:MBL fold metallo-hydrolase [Phenylobacterium montanum]|uniref:MBL fold metallo-hydrolase n=1 Tax=Phenylobacterium montanum TaxID=2823693 RepID=A0A975IWA3_9CAUL|nr:MBL fold metallo-hydrolase [Caulobacter sp. S6]QUD89625.1 MBL fold metallo-hydrolase [Caulobacter sp. S6]